MSPITRRSFLASSSIVLAPSVAHADVIRSDYPALQPEMVQEMVGVSHGNLVRVKELVAQHQTLAKAAWDWGFGDWEDALGAASHVGNPEIAEFLLANGARPTIFSAAMLGQLEAVKAFVEASPGVQRTKGPHSITLLRHAMAGGLRAQPVVDYLKTIEGADERPAAQPLTAADIAKLAGAYTFGVTAADRLEITANKELLSVARAGRTARPLTHLGSFEFVPAGAERVRLRFADSAGAMVLTVHDPDVVLTARKSG